MTEEQHHGDQEETAPNPPVEGDEPAPEPQIQPGEGEADPAEDDDEVQSPEDLPRESLEGDLNDQDGMEGEREEGFGRYGTEKHGD